MTTRYTVGPYGRKTHPLLWCAAILCTVLSVAVIIAGIVVFVGYIIIHPRIPIVAVISASLDTFRYDQSGLLVTQCTIVIRAENDNAKAHASFQDTSLVLSFGGMDIANLQAGQFDVKKNDSVNLPFVVASSPIPLDPDRMDLVGYSLRQDEVVFDLKGSSRAQWRVGPLGSVKYWCHLNCKLHFHPQKGTYSTSDRCSSRSK